MTNALSLPMTCNQAEQRLLISTCLALFAAVNGGRLIVNPGGSALEIRQTTALLDACYLVQDVVNGARSENLSAALEAVLNAQLIGAHHG